MHIDRKRATKAFQNYVEHYDANNARISLKVAHTYRVAMLCERITQNVASSSDYPFGADDVQLAWLCGLLHDIGRFEQVRRYDTFNDALSVSHAALGVQVLFGHADPRGPLIRSFVPDDAEDALICSTTATHSDYRIPSSFDERTKAHCNVLRDADKIDIIRVNCTSSIADIYGVSEDDMLHSELSTTVVEAFYEHRTIPRGIRRTPADILVGHLCFAWELVYPESQRILREQGHIDQMLSRRFANNNTQATFARMAHHMRTWLEL